MAETLRKLIFVNRYYAPDGSATSQLLTELAEELARSGECVVIVTSRQQYGNASAQLPRREHRNGVDVFRIWTTTFGRASLFGRSLDYLSFYLSSFFRLLVLVKPHDLLIAKTDPPMISVVGAFVAALRGACLINWIQDLFPEVAVRLGVGVVARAEPLLRRLRNLSLSSANVNVVLSRGMRDVLLSQCIADSRIAVIPNWADGHEIMPREASGNPLRKAWGLEDTFVVAYSGNIGRAHKFDGLLEAAYQLRSCEAICFLFIGDGAQRDHIEHVVKSRDLKNVIFKPFQDRSVLPLSLTVADVHVTSLAPALEGLIVPSKVYGVLAAGVPILHVGDPAGEIGSMVQEYDCGYAVLEDDHEGIIRYIDEMYRNPGRRRMQGRNARRLFEGKYDKSLSLLAWRKTLAPD